MKEIACAAFWLVVALTQQKGVSSAFYEACTPISLQTEILDRERNSPRITPVGHCAQSLTSRLSRIPSMQIQGVFRTIDAFFVQLDALQCFLQQVRHLFLRKFET